MSLPRRRILRERADFARVRAEGRAKAGAYLLVTAYPTGEFMQLSIFGFITPKYVGKAHERNLVRRRLRAMVKTDSELIAPGYQVVVLARRSVARAGFKALQADWRRLARKVGILAMDGQQPRDGGGDSRC